MITRLTAAAAGHQDSGGNRPGALGTWPAPGQLDLPTGFGWSHCLMHVPRGMFSTSMDELLGWC